MVLFWYISTGAQNVQTKHWLQISCFAFLACFVNPLSGIPVHLSSPCVLQKVNRNVKNDGPRPEVCICTSWMMTEAPSCNTMLVFCRRCFYSFVHPLYNTGKSAVVLKWSLPSSQNASGMTWIWWMGWNRTTLHFCSCQAFMLMCPPWEDSPCFQMKHGIFSKWTAHSVCFFSFSAAISVTLIKSNELVKIAHYELIKIT